MSFSLPLSIGLLIPGEAASICTILSSSVRCPFSKTVTLSAGTALTSRTASALQSLINVTFAYPSFPGGTFFKINMD